MDQLLFSPGIFRLFLASVVVINHATRLALGTWAVYIFFCLSGYWVTVMFRRKYSKYTKPFASFYISRYLRLLPIYVICKVLMIAVLLVSHVPTVLHGIHGLIWTARSLAILSSSWQPIYLGPAWSLDVEMQFYLLFPLLYYGLLKLPEKYQAIVLYTTAAVCLVFSYFAFTNVGSLLYYIGFFLLGVSNGIKPWKPARRIGLSSALLFLGLVAVFCLVHNLRGYILIGAHTSEPLKAHYNHLLCTVLSLVCYPYVCYSLTFRSTSLDKQLGNLAYPVYLFHWISQFLIADNRMHLPLSRIELFALHIVVTATVSVALYLLYDQPLDNIREKFIDNRFRKRTPTTNQNEVLAA